MHLNKLDDDITTSHWIDWIMFECNEYGGM